MSWRLANSLIKLRDQINEAYPNRAKASDGTIGDAAHAASVSDHNPNADGVVSAMDITNSPQTGFNVHALADRLRVNRHPDIKYIISNRRIAGAWTNWAWTPYSGSNPHTLHAHFSVGRGNDGYSTQPYDDPSPWFIGDTPQVARPGSKSIDEIADEVIAGKWGNGIDRTTTLSSAGYDSSAVQSRVNELLGGGGAAPRKSNTVIAREVLAGAWGNGYDRRSALTAAGYGYNVIQAIVNQKATPAQPTRASNEDIARQVIAGAWGNNPERANKLKAAGYDPNAVQAVVNTQLGTGTVNSRKTNDQVANEIIAGQGGWGVNPQRMAKLQGAGYNYSAVQSIVNKKLGF